MTVDRNNRLADAVSLVGQSSVGVLGDVVNLGAASNYIGDGEQLFLVVECATQMTAGTPATIQFYVVSDSTSTLASGVLASCTEHARSILVELDAQAEIAAGIEAGTAGYLPNIAPNSVQTGITDPGKVLNRPPILALPLPVGTYEQYLGVIFSIVPDDAELDPTLLTGAVSAYLVKDATQCWRPKSSRY